MVIDTKNILSKIHKNYGKDKKNGGRHSSLVKGVAFYGAN